MSHRADAAAPDGPGRWLEPAPRGWLLSLRVQPGARRTELQGVADGRLRVRLAAPPVEGKANEALLRWLADRLGLRLRDLELVSGQTSRQKRVRIDCAMDGAELERRLLSAP